MVPHSLSSHHKVGAQEGLETRLLRYLRLSLVKETALSEVMIEEFVSAAGNRPLELNLRTADKEPMPLLHLVVLNEATQAPALEHVLTKLLQLGAAPEAEDDDGDNALGAMLCTAFEHEEDGETLLQAALVAQLGALCALLQSKRLPINQKEINAVCAWLRRFAAGQTDARQRVLDVLATRCGNEDLAVAWYSELLMGYLDNQAYERKHSVEAQRVLDFLAKGASPCHKTHGRNGVTALLLIVLNPYNKYEELLPTFRSMLSADPVCVTIRDGFNLTPMQWAADYRSICSQHNLPEPNPANILALLPSVIEVLPDDVDAGEVCLMTAPETLRDGTARSLPAQELRFKKGERVSCRVGGPGGSYVWAEGTVVGLWYREACWPEECPGAPYEVLLDAELRHKCGHDHDHGHGHSHEHGRGHPEAPYQEMLHAELRVFALVDHERIIRKRSQPLGGSNSHCSSSHPSLTGETKRLKSLAHNQAGDAWELCCRSCDWHGYARHSFPTSRCTPVEVLPAAC